MSDTAQNPAELDMFSEVQLDTQQEKAVDMKTPSHAFLAKSIHPPSPVANYEGLPTNDARTQVVAEWRNISLLNVPYIADNTTQVVRAVTVTDLPTFDYAFLSMNGMRVLHIPFITNATAPGGLMLQDFNNVQKQDLYDTKGFSQDATLYRPIYKSTTMYPNVTAFNNTGMVVVEQFNPNILFGGSIEEFSYSKPKEFFDFVTCQHKTNKYKAISLSDHESMKNWMKFPAHIRAEIQRRCNLNPSDGLSMDPNTNIQIVMFGKQGSSLSSIPSIVPSLSQTSQASMRSYAGKFNEGTFTV
jgi:hypothetical protein